MSTFEQHLQTNKVIFYSFFLLCIACTLYLFKDTPAICDEQVHYQESFNFSNGNFELLQISNVPGYHALMALLFKITGISSFLFARCLNALFGFFTVVAFYKLANRLTAETAVLRTLQYFFFPIIFIFYFLVYTDILSLLFVILMFSAAVEKRYVLAGVHGILSMLIRQNNVMWLAMVPVLAYVETTVTASPCSKYCLY